MLGEQITVGQLTEYWAHDNAYIWHDDYYDIHVGITTKYIDRYSNIVYN